MIGSAAQVVAAIQRLLAGANRWTGTNRFGAIEVDSCEGCGGGGTVTTSAPLSGNGDPMTPVALPVEGEVNGNVLMVAAAPTSPTFAEILALRPYLYITGWTATFNYATAQGQSDVVQYLKPTGSSNVFAAEVSGGGLTGMVEPTWASAPDPGDDISDGDLTWYNAGPASAFPPTPTTWLPLTEYTVPSFVWPLIPNGHLYAAFPPGPLTSGTTQPDFPVVDSTYVADGDGYWMDTGYVEPASSTAEWSRLQTITAPTDEDGLAVYVNGNAYSLLLLNSTLTSEYGLGFRLSDNGDQALLSSKPFRIDTDGSLNLASGGQGAVTLSVLQHGSGGDLTALIIRAATEAPDDAELSAGDMGLWLDPTNGTPKLMIKAKQVNGTVVTGSVLLTP